MCLLRYLSKRRISKSSWQSLRSMGQKYYRPPNSSVIGRGLSNSPGSFYALWVSENWVYRKPGLREGFFSDSRRIRVKGRKDRVLNRASALRLAHKNTELSTKPLGPVPSRERPPAAATLRAGRTPPALPPACPPRSGLSVCRASRVACH